MTKNVIVNNFAKKIGHPVDLLHDAVIVRQTLEKQSRRQFNCE